MGMNLKLSASASGTRNTFDNELNFSTYGGAPGASAATNTSAIDAFNTAYAALTGRTRLTIAPGDYNFTAGSPVGWWGRLGGDRLTISAYGATLRNQSGFAASGQVNDNAHHANIATVSAGTSTVSLVTPAQTSRFSVNQWVLVTEGDLQGAAAFPTNPWKFEYKQILSIGTGTLTFTAPLEKAYSSTFPNYYAGDASNVYAGGPATIYAMPAAWNQEIELQGATLPDTGNLFYCKVKVAKTTDCAWETYGPCPTNNLLFRATRVTVPGTAIEVDKMVQRMEVIDSALHAVDFQSKGINELYVSGTTASQYWRGVAGGDSTIIGLNTPEFRFGVTGYGVVAGLTTVASCDSANATWSPGYSFLFSSYTEAGGGVLTITTSTPVTWAVPGGQYVLTDSANAFNNISFRVTDITASGGVTSITTTLPFPVPATSGGKSAPWSIHPHPGAHVTATGCTGSSLFTSQSALPADSPLFGWTLG